MRSLAKSNAAQGRASIGDGPERAARGYRGKRVFDLAVAVPASVLLAPVMAVVACLVRARLGSPVLFRQQRPGLHGRPFTLYKFRSMTAERDSAGELLPDAQRMTRFGRLLRATSLDELPELFNVLRGEMSIVGPRPLLMEYLDRYAAEQARRHEVKPGMTGWTQVMGRNALDWETKFERDVWYVDHQSLWVDLEIVLRTTCSLLRRSGISYEDHATMPKFDGISRSCVGHPE